LKIKKIKEVLFIDLKEPCGWYTFPLKTKLFNGSEKYLILILIIFRLFVATINI
jgi:hypothetical protein